MTIVRVKLRQKTAQIDEHDEVVVDGRGRVQFTQPDYDEVDLDKLSPRARALAEAVAASPLSTASEVWVESDAAIRDRLPDWETWYSAERAAQGERRPWSAWDKYRATDGIDPHDWLERQAAKIPDGWHVLGADPHHPVPTQERGEEWTSAQVLDYLATQGKHINATTWRSYVAREQAPQPVRKVGRTPLWDAAEIRARYARSS